MKKVFLKPILSLIIALGSSNAFAGGGGSGWTQCYAKELGYSYSFSGYTQSLAVGKMMTVFTVSPNTKEYGYYRVDSIDLSQDVGTIELSHLPDTDTSPKVSTDTDFGNMKIEYFSNSAIKDIRVTFSKNGVDSVSNAVTCTTD